MHSQAEGSAKEFARRLMEDEIAEKPRRLGNYEILKELGRGGMGAVFLARRADAQYEKHVAIKLIKRGMDTDAVLRHFRDERQILAGFDHPNIARLFDAGTTPDGLPYFVMEYVEALPVTRYCDTHQLTVTDRLKLFREICSAVSYAHRHLVIHRDLKPSNIVVTVEGVPKLLDFGIAKVLQQGGVEQPQVTLIGMRLMTPEYASPEQVRGEPVTTATDIYSLGVVLYELLSGSSPYEFTSRSPIEMERAITQGVPRKPSSAPNCKSLRGDLDNIALMALRKEPDRRYKSVDQFSDDIRRYLESRPITARPDNLTYSAAKFVQRNRIATAAAALVLSSLVAGVIATTLQAKRARAQEAIARTEKARAERQFSDLRQLAHSVLFDYHDAIKDLPGATRARERLVRDGMTYLDRLSNEAQGDIDLQRELAAAYERLGDVRGQQYASSLGDRAGALDSYGKALRIRERLGASAAHTVEDRHGLATLERKLGNALLDTPDAERGLEHLRHAVESLSALAAEGLRDAEVRRDLSGTYNDLGLALEDRGEMSRALDNHRHALAIREELLRMDPTNRLDRRGLSSSYENIGRILALTGNLKGALDHNGRAMALREMLLKDDPTNADYRRILAISYQNKGDYLALANDAAGAVESFRKKLALDERAYAADPDNAQARGDLAYSCQRLGELLGDLRDYTAAVPFDERSIDLNDRNAAADAQNFSARLGAAVSRASLAEAFANTGKAADGSKLCQQTLSLLQAIPDQPANMSQHSLQSHAFIKLGDAYAALTTSPENQRATRECYQRAVDIMREDRGRGLLNPDDEAELNKISAKLTN